MRTTLAVLALVGSLLGIFLAPPPVAPPGHVTWPLALYGDSLMFGRSASDYPHSLRGRFVAYEARNPRLAVRVEYQPANFTQYGATWHSGWTLANALTAEQVAPPTANTVVIVLEIGTNDAINGTPLATFTTGYQTLIARLVAAAPSAEIVCLNVWNVASLAQPYDAAIAAACPGGRVVDLTSLYAQGGLHGPVGVPESWLGNYTTDAFHPNDAGDAAIAAGIEAVL